MSLILSMSGNALMLQIDNLSAYCQNFISFKVKKALRISKKEKPTSLQFRLIYESPIHTRGVITMVHCYGSLPLTSLSERINICFWATELEIGDSSSKAYPSSSHKALNHSGSFGKNFVKLKKKICYLPAKGWSVW